MAKQLLCCTKTRFIVGIYVYIEDWRGKLANFLKSNQVTTILFCHENYFRMGWNFFKLTSFGENSTVNYSQWFCTLCCVLSNKCYFLKDSVKKWLRPNQFGEVYATYMKELVNNFHWESSLWMNTLCSLETM